MTKFKIAAFGIVLQIPLWVPLIAEARSSWSVNS